MSPATYTHGREGEGRPAVAAGTVVITELWPDSLLVEHRIRDRKVANSNPVATGAPGEYFLLQS